MSSIFQIMSLPEKGTAMSLDNVRVSAKYAAKQTANGKWMRNIQVSDASGQAGLTLWGDAANLPVNDGSTVTFKGVLRKNSYNGKDSIAAEQVTIEGGAAAPASAPTSSPSYSGSSEDKIDHEELARQMAIFTAALGKHLIHVGISKETTEQMIVRAPEYAALWWFGAKALNVRKPKPAPAAPVDPDFIPYGDEEGEGPGF